MSVIFSLDASGAAASAAITRDGTLVCEAFLNLGRTHSETLLPLCDTVFQKAGMTPSDIDCFAVTDGPGSFTGVRIGIGTIKGMAFAANKPCAAISASLALAAPFAGCGIRVASVIDARRGRVYHAEFLDGMRMCEDSVLEAEALISDLRDLSQPVLFVGSGAAICYNMANKTGFGRIAPAPFHEVSARFLAESAESMLLAGLTTDANALRPRYLQPSQAERARMERESGN